MDYISIRVSTLRGDQKISFNTYIKINEKMVLYLKKGDSFEGDRLKKLKDKKLRKMFIVTDEEVQYIDYLDKNINIAYDNNSGKDIQTRAEIIHGDQQSKTEELFEDLNNIKSYDMAKSGASKYVDFILTNTDALRSIMNMHNIDQNIDQKIAHHGIAVATLAIVLADKLGITDKKQTELLSLGGLLHDCGHFESTIDYTKPRLQMRPAELSYYLTHPRVGSEKVSDKKHFDQTITNIILQHEECIDGSGPEKLTEAQTDPLAVLIASANALDRLISYQGVAKRDAAQMLIKDSARAHPSQHLQILEEIFKNS